MLDDGIKLWFSIIGVIFTGIMGILMIMPMFAKVELWTANLSGQAILKKAEWSRQVKVVEAKATMDSSIMLANAEVERAKGVAAANKIIGDSLKGNEGYLRYLWIDSLQHTKDKVIYVPTEAGLPILETTRLNKVSKHEQ
jgi:hypothetical protein